PLDDERIGARAGDPRFTLSAAQRHGASDRANRRSRPAECCKAGGGSNEARTHGAIRAERRVPLEAPARLFWRRRGLRALRRLRQLPRTVRAETSGVVAPSTRHVAPGTQRLERQSPLRPPPHEQRRDEEPRRAEIR